MTRIAVYQSRTGIDPAANSRALVGAVHDAAAGGAAILFTPEMSGLLDSDRPLLVLASKADKLKKSQLKPALEAIARHHGLPEAPLPFSSLSKSGLDDLWEQIRLLVSA